jgi:hypothetical protein
MLRIDTSDIPRPKSSTWRPGSPLFWLSEHKSFDGAAITWPESSLPIAFARGQFSPHVNAMRPLALPRFRILQVTRHRSLAVRRRFESCGWRWQAIHSGGCDESHSEARAAGRRSVADSFEQPELRQHQDCGCPPRSSTTKASRARARTEKSRGLASRNNQEDKRFGQLSDFCWYR